MVFIYKCPFLKDLIFEQIIFIPRTKPPILNQEKRHTWRINSDILSLIEFDKAKILPPSKKSISAAPSRSHLNESYSRRGLVVAAKMLQ